MTKEIDIKNAIFDFDEKAEPAEYCNSGDTVIFNSYDFVLNKLQTENDLKSDLVASGFERQSLCGMLYVNGAEPGDTLKVHIDNIEITSDFGTICLYEPDFEVLGQYIESEKTLKIPIKDGRAYFCGGKVSYPLKPMIGAIGVCNAGIVEDTIAPGTFGGNIDCKMIGIGTTLYLPVTVPGALLAMGDAHGIQGDGEIFQALEVPSRITVTVEVIKNRQETWPVLETDDAWYILASTDGVDAANRAAMEGMVEFLSRRSNEFTKEDWVVLMGIAGDLELNNVVDPRVSTRMKMPKTVTAGIEF